MLRHKFHAVPSEEDGLRFDSKAEAAYYRQLRQQQADGLVLGFLTQVPFRLPGKTSWVADFLVFYTDGRAAIVDVKGTETETFRLKLRQVKEIYPWAAESIEIVDAHSLYPSRQPSGRPHRRRRT